MVIQHAAGIAQSWRSNYATAYQDYLDMLADDEQEPQGDPPVWKEWSTPVLKEPVIQANANVALLEPAEGSGFDYWLRISTLEPRHPLFLTRQTGGLSSPRSCWHDAGHQRDLDPEGRWLVADPQL